jgi:hypothetical protein
MAIPFANLCRGVRGSSPSSAGCFDQMEVLVRWVEGLLRLIRLRLNLRVSSFARTVVQGHFRIAVGTHVAVLLFVKPKPAAVEQELPTNAEGTSFKDLLAG